MGTRRRIEGTCTGTAEEVEPVLLRAARRSAAASPSVSGVESPVCVLTHPMERFYGGA